MVSPILPVTVSNANVRKRGKTIIGPISLEIGPKGNTIIIGPNGSGKTTLLRLLHGLERIKGGDVKWAISTQQATHAQSFVFQTPIMMRRNTLDNLTYPLILKKADKTQATNKAQEWLERLGMENIKNLDARLLSGGEKQKLALARALITNPQLLILDEPTANLDGRATKDIEQILTQASSDGVKIIMTTHDLGQAKRMADDVIFLYNGLLHEQSAAISFFRKPKTAEAKAFLKGDIVE